jgi:hypothetical protein
MSHFYYQHAKDTWVIDGGMLASGWMVFERGFVDDETGEPMAVALCAKRAVAAAKRDALNTEYEREMKALMAEGDRAVEAERKRAKFKIV